MNYNEKIIIGKQDKIKIKRKLELILKPMTSSNYKLQK